MVKQFVKNTNNEWIEKEYFAQDSILKLDSIDFTISLKDLYKGIDFETFNT